jgi:hypothetical protein
MNSNKTTKQAGGFPDKFSKEPVKQQENSQNEPDSKAGFSGRPSGGMSFLLDLQPQVEGVQHWGLND